MLKWKGAVDPGLTGIWDQETFCAVSVRESETDGEKRGEERKKRKSVRDIDRGMREREKVKYSDVIALRLSGRAIMDLHRPAASSLSGYDMMAEF